MSDQFVAEIRMFGMNFAARQWAQCDGQILPIQQNTALFSLIGTYYGGNGQSTFALPNLVGHVPLCVGQGFGLSQYVLGEVGGEPTHALVAGENAIHTHNINASTDPGTSASPNNLVYRRGEMPGSPPTGISLYNSGAANVTMNSQTLA